MNVDEAMKTAGSGILCFRGHAAVSVLSAEVERLRAELKVADKWLYERSEAYGKTCSMVDQLQTELAAARNQSRNDADAITEQALRVLDSSEVDGDSDSVPPTMPELVELMADAAVMAMEERKFWHSAAQRLKAELAAARKDWCDDDEQIKKQALRVLAKFEVEGDSVHVPRMAELAEMMADTAMRHKEECLAWIRVAQDKERELAAAKAASRCPVELVALGDADWECSVGVKCKSDDDANKLFDWLWERINERGEG